MIELRDTDTGAQVGFITDEQLQFMIDQLEEESPDDQTYWLNRATLEMFRDNGADAELLATLEAGLGEREDFEVEWG
jgi:processive 1,2-diacylglycerol beta-glucosyltransferase